VGTLYDKIGPLRRQCCCQVLEDQAAEAAAARATAEADLARVKGKGRDIQRKARLFSIHPSSPHPTFPEPDLLHKFLSDLSVLGFVVHRASQCFLPVQQHYMQDSVAKGNQSATLCPSSLACSSFTVLPSQHVILSVLGAFSVGACRRHAPT
jgi:hypothetical protein